MSLDDKMSEIRDAMQYSPEQERLHQEILELGGVENPEDGSDPVRLEPLPEDWVEQMVGKPDMVNHPPHYSAHPSGVECIRITEHMNFCVGNAVKYLWRADLKNGIEDLEKAAWYVAREIERRRSD